jgi:hypothetical protein
MREDEQDNFPVTRLLRLKRYEQPPPEYFEKFLCEFQQRQRSELLRRPAWRIAFEQFGEQLEGLRGLFSASQLSYATASLAVLAVAGVVTLDILRHPGGSAVAIASNEPALSQEPAFAHAQSVAQPAVSSAYAAAPGFTIDSPLGHSETFQPQTGQPGATSLHPHYILDARPVSYEPPSRF